MMAFLQSATLVGILASLYVFSLFIFILANYPATDERLVLGFVIVFVLFFDLLHRIEIVVGRQYENIKTWSRRARIKAAFGTLYLLLPLIWCFSDHIYSHYGIERTKLDDLLGLDRTVIFGTAVYNIMLGFM